MTWNYRVIMDGIGLSIHEVYYHKDGSISMTVDPVTPWGLDKKELKKSLRRMVKALDKPILDEDGKEIGD